MIANKEIKQTAQARGVRMWEIADKLKMTDSTFSKKLRHELSEQKKNYILNLIEEIAEEKRGCNQE